MALVTADRVKDSTTTTGTGSVTLSGSAPTGFRAFSAVMSTGDTCYYCISSSGGAEWEVGLGTLTASTTLARTTVLASSNGGNLVTLSAGTKDVFVTAPAAQFTAPTIDSLAAFNAVYGAPLGYDQEFDATSSSSLPSGWSWVNQGTSTYQEQFGAAALTPQTGVNDQLRMFVQSMTGLPSTWTLTAKITGKVDATNTVVSAGIAFRDSATGKVTTAYCTPGNGQVGVANYTNALVFTSALVAGTTVKWFTAYSAAAFYLRVTKNSSTSFDFLISPDGVVWTTVAAAQNMSTYLTPDQFGFVANPYNNVMIYPSISWFRVR